MKSELFGRIAFIPGRPSGLLDRGLALGPARRQNRRTAIPHLRVLPRPESSVSESWVILEMRRRRRDELYQDALFLILSLSAAAAIICATYA